MLTSSCTLWFDRLWDWDWSACCVAHDIAWAQVADFWASNIDLMTCANAVIPGLGVLMFLGVSSFVGMGFYLKAVIEKWWRDTHNSTGTPN